MTPALGRLPCSPRARVVAGVVAAVFLPACLTPPAPLPPPEVVPRTERVPGGPGETAGAETTTAPPGVYLVQRGDTLWSIAARHHVPLRQLILINGIDRPEDLEVGTRLHIPDEGEVVSLPVKESLGPALHSFDGSIPSEPGWRWPLAGVPRLLARYTPTRPGIDLDASPGETVFAARTGAVVFAGEGFARLGTIVLLDHGGGTFSLYGFLQEATVAEGTLVRRGEPLGRAGSSGDAASPRLHFRILENALPRDPLQRLPMVATSS